MNRAYKIAVKPVLNEENKRVMDASGTELVCVYIMATYKRNTTKVPTGYYISRRDYAADKIPKEVLHQTDIIRMALEFERDRTGIDTIRQFGKRYRLYQKGILHSLTDLRLSQIETLIRRTMVAKEYYAWMRLVPDERIKQGLIHIEKNSQLDKLPAIDPMKALSPKDAKKSTIEVICDRERWARKIGLVDYILSVPVKNKWL